MKKLERSHSFILLILLIFTLFTGACEETNNESTSGDEVAKKVCAKEKSCHSEQDLTRCIQLEKEGYERFTICKKEYIEARASCYSTDTSCSKLAGDHGLACAMNKTASSCKLSSTKGQPNYTPFLQPLDNMCNELTKCGTIPPPLAGILQSGCNGKSVLAMGFEMMASVGQVPGNPSTTLCAPNMLQAKAECVANSACDPDKIANCFDAPSFNDLFKNPTNFPCFGGLMAAGSILSI